MSDESTPRLDLPLLQAGQAQKELSHNEALTLLDLAVQPVVTAVGRNDPPDTASVGACWIVGAAPSGAWGGHAHALAGWTGGGWRFVAACDAMSVWSLADGSAARFVAGAWTIGMLHGSTLTLGGLQVLGPRQPAVMGPVGGGTIDIEARAALGAVLTALRTHGLIAT